MGFRRRARPSRFGGTIIPRTYPRAPDCQSMSPLLFGRRRESMTWPELSGAISRQRSDGRRRQEPSCCYATMTTDAARLGLPGQWTENRVRSLGASRTAGPGAGRGDTSFDSHIPRTFPRPFLSYSLFIEASAIQARMRWCGPPATIEGDPHNKRQLDGGAGPHPFPSHGSTLFRIRVFTSRSESNRSRTP